MAYLSMPINQWHRTGSSLAANVVSFFNIQKKIKRAVTRLASHTSGRLWPLRRHSTDVKVKVFISKKKRLRTIYGCYDF